MKKVLFVLPRGAHQKHNYKKTWAIIKETSKESMEVFNDFLNKRSNS